MVREAVGARKLTAAGESLRGRRIVGDMLLMGALGGNAREVYFWRGGCCVATANMSIVDGYTRWYVQAGVVG